ncbi:MAG: cobalt-precorrin-5B (C(1))-methyltransferase CbiD [Lachnospiraceae bacterium]|nr:cobalt-precorrin-5B (C(1))-methyltransferase CbiD [Lachnospiraceae bacterium]
MECSNDKKIKNGFTTGSCAAAATKAALMMLISGKKINEIKIITPSSDIYSPQICNAAIAKLYKGKLSIGDYASASVIKESGDDPDITNSLEIVSFVTFVEGQRRITIKGGEGVGKVTRPGLDQPVGEYAINSTPRKMITEVVEELLENNDIDYGVEVTISVPKGCEIAEKTFNPHMGIEGGISIIGTTGIVKPMSTEALVETIKLDINMQYSEGKKTCIIVPGNYGVTFLTNKMNVSDKDIVLCSNFAGDSVKMAVDAGFRKILFCSHIGKMIKVSGGVLNTHSMYGDRRMEFMVDAFVEAVNNNQGKIENTRVTEIKNRIMECVSTTAALDVISEIDFVKEVSSVIVNRTVGHLSDACDNKAEINVILYENNYGELARSF